jgi:hypothetical protein
LTPARSKTKLSRTRARIGTGAFIGNFELRNNS